VANPLVFNGHFATLLNHEDPPILRLPGGSPKLLAKTILMTMLHSPDLFKHFWTDEAQQKITV